jgi:hypothetical protein
VVIIPLVYFLRFAGDTILPPVYFVNFVGDNPITASACVKNSPGIRPTRATPEGRPVFIVIPGEYTRDAPRINGYIAGELRAYAPGIIIQNLKNEI